MIVGHRPACHGDGREAEIAIAQSLRTRREPLRQAAPCDTFKDRDVRTMACDGYGAADAPAMARLARSYDMGRRPGWMCLTGGASERSVSTR